MMAVVVAVQTVVEPLYHTSTEESPYSPAWAVLGWLMFVPLALGVAFGYSRKKAAEGGGGGGAVTREVVAANVHFYGACSSASCLEPPTAWCQGVPVRSVGLPQLGSTLVRTPAVLSRTPRSP